ncbi:MAG: glucose-6-phosphate isomerase, partial [Muribaculaceae bacterium]|nr:glucose-6-phosphate isomerase [Muribaculaceae bacterium]
MKQIELSIKNALGTVSKSDVDALKPVAQQSLAKLTDGSGLGNDFLGCVKLPSETPSSLLDDINATA